MPDAGTADASRLYDYLLGGKDNLASDRRLMDEARAVMPAAEAAVRAQRLFVDRAVTFLVGEAGVRQILDIGGGMPTQGFDNVHEIAQRSAPQTRVVYVDNNPVVVTHRSALHADGKRTAAVHGDLREPEAIVQHPETSAILDFTQPVGVLLAGILHFITDAEDPAGIVARLRDAVSPGSYLVINHISSDLDPHVRDVIPLFARASAPMVDRSREQLEPILDGFELVEPGLVPVNQWRPQGPVRNACDAYGAVARKV